MALSLQQTVQQTRILQQRPEQRERSWSHVIVNAIADCVQDDLEKILPENGFSELMLSGPGQEHLVHRLAEDVIQASGTKFLTEILGLMNQETSAVDAIDGIHDGVAQFVGPVLQQWHDNFQIFHPRKKRPDTKSDPSGRMGKLMELLDQRYRSDSREFFEQVRSSNYRQMTSADVPEIARTYRSALLDSSTLELLCRTEDKMPEEEILKNIELFRNKIRKGVFIWDIEENSFREDLEGKSLKETGMDFRGRVLEDENGKILSWLTYKHAPNTPNARQRKYVQRYLHRGVTNGKIGYDNESLPSQQFIDNWDKIELFQDIRSLHPFAADRLASLAFSEMKIANPNLRYIFAYRLYDLFVNPPLDFMHQTRSTGVLPSQNDKSYSKFFSWGFRHLAYDFNPKECAPHALRKDVSGVDRRLNPKWGIITGSIDDVVTNSTKQYRDIQIQHGDLSNDQFKARWIL